MARRNRKKKKGLNPIAAIAILGCSVMFVTKPYWSAEETVSSLAGLIGFEDDPDMGIEGPQELAVVQYQDLLAAYGSFQASDSVARAFSTTFENLQFAAPGGETQHYERGRWTGVDPPMVRVGVIMVSESSRRAVLNGAVLGIGDDVGTSEATVASIRRGLVRLRWRKRDLTYDLDSTAPREFRAEQTRRREKAQAEGAGSRQANGTRANVGIEEK